MFCESVTCWSGTQLVLFRSLSPSFWRADSIERPSASTRVWKKKRKKKNKWIQRLPCAPYAERIPNHGAVCGGACTRVRTYANTPQPAKRGRALITLLMIHLYIQTGTLTFSMELRWPHLSRPTVHTSHTSFYAFSPGETDISCLL